MATVDHMTMGHGDGTRHHGSGHGRGTQHGHPHGTAHADAMEMHGPSPALPLPPRRPTVLAATDEETDARVRKAKHPLERATLGDIGLSVRVAGATSFPPTILLLPFERDSLRGIDHLSVRVFRVDARGRTATPLWNSGINLALGYVWAKITRPGTYVAIGLPRDPLLQDCLRVLAQQRRYAEHESREQRDALTEAVLAPFLETPERELHQLRQLLAQVEVQTSPRPLERHEVRHGKGGYILPFPLPHGLEQPELREELTRLETPPHGLPEEALFFPPEIVDEPERPKIGPDFPSPLPFPTPPSWLWPRPFPPLPIPRPPLCWFFSKDWWMYHRDAEHTGHASGCSSINSCNVGSLTLRHTVPLNGEVATIPTVVNGKVYIGTVNVPGGMPGGGVLYKIDLASGAIEATFATPVRTPAYFQGIGGSPAVVGNRVYASAVPGRVHCLDATTLAELWTTDLRVPSQGQNQPVRQNNTDCWSGPLVVDGKVYVGSGEGEFGAYGFIYCLDANDGRVLWLFSTNQFVTGTDNDPNVIPRSVAVSDPLPAWASAFALHDDPPQRGVSVWSSCGYDPMLNRIYAGTGNATIGDAQPLPDANYGSGVLALDASTGSFRGFFQPTAADCYRANDTDVDVCAGPLLFQHGGNRVCAIGSKGGGFFLLDAATMAPLKKRQLLPYDTNGNPLPNVDPHTGPDENMFGVFGNAAVHYGLKRLYVGIGGYGGAIDSGTTPFMRALDWNTLDDAWATAVGSDHVARYTVPRPPMYSTPGECGLSSPAVVNDVVFCSTTKPGLYAFCAHTGLCLWSATGLTGQWLLGPAVYGNSLVIGAGANLRLYSL
jgi:outer membrane protein assembly factor BamB